MRPTSSRHVLKYWNGNPKTQFWKSVSLCFDKTYLFNLRWGLSVSNFRVTLCCWKNPISNFLEGFWGTLNPETGVKTVQIWCLRWVFFITTFKSFIFADTRTPLQSTVFCKSWTQRKGHCFILGFGNVTNSLILMIFNSVRFKNRTSTSLRLVSSCKMQWFQ